MTLAKAYKDVTFTLVAGESYIDPDTGEVAFKGDSIEAEIVNEDNDNPECYLVDVEYYLRLYRSRESMHVITRSNFGSVKLNTKGIETDIENEVVLFTGSDSTTSDKFIKGNFIYTPIGIVYTISGTEYGSGISGVTSSNTIKADEKIVGIYEVSYLSKYDRYKFSSPRLGRMIILFIGQKGLERI